MTDWKQFEKESTEDLIQYIKWKEQPDYLEAAKAAFAVFCYRFRADIVKKCEIICERWKHEISVADELANRVFNNFWHNPNYDHSRRRNAKTFDEGVLFYLYGIANNELTNIYRQQIDPSPYTGEEEIIWDFPEIDMDSISIERKKELIERREIIEMALSRLTTKHRAIYFTYMVHGRKGKNLPTHLYRTMQDTLGLAQTTIRYYNFEANKTINDYLKIWDKKINISEDNFAEWAASTGNMFPRNLVELKRFEKLYSGYEYKLSEKCVDPFAIINGDFKPNTKLIQLEPENNAGNFNIAARNLDSLPEHILNKLKRKQNGQESED